MYLLTASITELGKDEAWFWGSEPRLVFYLVEEKKKIDLEKMKVTTQKVGIAYLMKLLKRNLITLFLKEKKMNIVKI